jgi:hypothetical protein
MDIEVELSKIIINESSDQQIIVLKERYGQRSFPIVIGIVEIFAIDRRLKGIQPPRPMTHDLLDSVIHKRPAEPHLLRKDSFKLERQNHRGRFPPFRRDCLRRRGERSYFCCRGGF